MFDLLGNIVDFISTLVNFIISFFKNVIEMVQLVFKGFAYAIELFAFLPAQYQVSLVALVSFAVIVTILNFGGQ